MLSTSESAYNILFNDDAYRSTEPSLSFEGKIKANSTYETTTTWTYEGIWDYVRVMVKYFFDVIAALLTCKKWEDFPEKCSKSFWAKHEIQVLKSAKVNGVFSSSSNEAEAVIQFVLAATIPHDLFQSYENVFEFLRDRVNNEPENLPLSFDLSGYTVCISIDSSDKYRKAFLNTCWVNPLGAYWSRRIELGVTENANGDPEIFIR